MSTSAEITYAIQNEHQSLTFHISAQGEGNSTPDLRGMLSQIQEAVTEVQNNPKPKLLSNTEVVVQDVPHPTPATPKPQMLPLADNQGKNFSQNFSSKTNTGAPTSKKSKITAPQIATIRQNLVERNIPECVFCNKYGVKRVEDLPGSVAWHVIHDHLY